MYFLSAAPVGKTERKQVQGRKSRYCDAKEKEQEITVVQPGEVACGFGDIGLADCDDGVVIQ